MSHPESALTPFRALDLTNERGFLCGKILAELGADVIKIEPPGGDPSRRHGPFYQNKPDPENSLYWWAFNTSKRGVTLDLKDTKGQDVFKKLVKTTDFIFESFAPGYLDSMGLGYSILKQINPGLIFVSITPYGQTGPHKDFKATDLTLMAMGGQMSVSGDSDRPPVRISVPQAYLHGGLNAAAGCLIALHNREKTGAGQYIDVSIHESIVRTLGPELTYWYYAKEQCHRHGPSRPRAEILVRDIWPCQDGYLTVKVFGGPRLKEIKALIDWMVREGKGGALKDVNWDNMGTFTRFDKEVEEAQELIGRFFAEHKVSEIMELALKEQLPIMPNNSLAGVRHDEQLAARNFWATVKQPQTGRSIAYPGAPFKMSETPWKLRSPAPRIGEHNQEVMAELDKDTPDATAPSVQRNELKELLRPGNLPHQALEGVKIVDFTWVLTGPLTVKYLANFGADAIKIESRARLDFSRVTIPYKDGVQGVNRSGPFQVFNGGKRSLALNMSHPRGRELAKKMVAWADVVVDNFTPGTMDKWGMGYLDLTKIKSDIIMLSASLQGNSGPHYQHPGYGWNLSGLAGFNYLTGWPDRSPVSPHIAYTDWVAPVYGVIAIMAAMEYRRRTGKGQQIDLSQFETGVSFLSAPMLDYAVNENVQSRRGNRSNGAAPHNAYPCRGNEQWCTIAVLTEEEWQGLCRVMGNPAWGTDPRFSNLQKRKENEDELDRLVASWTITLSAGEVMNRLQAVGVPSGKVQTNRDLIEGDSHLRERGFFSYLQHPEIGTTLIPREPMLMDVTPPRCRRAPSLGEDTEYICREILGVSEAEYAELKAAKVLE
ncbi:MAG: CoA transferase [Dehalococcoidia bacterium]|nr:CoA transferase [Dehalococcoidia bacterium]